MKIQFKNEINLSHLISFFGTLIMIGIVWGTFKEEQKYMRRDIDNEMVEHKEFRQALKSLSDSVLILTAHEDETAHKQGVIKTPDKP